MSGKVSQNEGSEVRLIERTYGGVDIIHAEARIQAGECRDGWPNPARGDCCRFTLDGPIMAVKDLYLSNISEQ